jgi:hypothetical protein
LEPLEASDSGARIVGFDPGTDVICDNRQAGGGGARIAGFCRFFQIPHKTA